MRRLNMRLIGLGLYTCAALLANTASADLAEIAALRDGDMAKLSFHTTPEAASDQTFTHEDGSALTLGDFAGQITLVNFWATWCAPCREEMPALANLQTALGGDDFQVVTIATGRNPRPAMERFFAEHNITNLPLHTDPKQALARDMGVLGLPVTVILDRNGMEIARLFGDAHWDSDSAKAIIAALIATPAS